MTMSEKLMKLINARSGEMECRVCGATRFADIKPLGGRHFYDRDWDCTNGCRILED
jgi:hypothetical protein